MKLSKSEAFILEQLKATYKFETLRGNKEHGNTERCTIRSIENPSIVYATAHAGTEREAFVEAIREAQLTNGVPAGPESKDEALKAEVNDLRSKVEFLLAELQKSNKAAAPATPAKPSDEAVPPVTPPTAGGESVPPDPKTGDIPPVLPPQGSLNITGRGRAGAKDPNKA